MGQIPDELLNKIMEKWEMDTLELIPDPFITKMKVGETELLMLVEKLKYKTYLCFDILLDLTAVDFRDYFSLIYVFYSTHLRYRLMVRCDIPRERSRVLSLTNLYLAADVLEREVYDLLGIEFIGHPNLKRIIMADDFVGHPLRKDYKPEEDGRVGNG